MESSVRKRREEEECNIYRIVYIEADPVAGGTRVVMEEATAWWSAVWIETARIL